MPTRPTNTLPRRVSYMHANGCITVTNTGFSSSHYGDCEICGTHVSEVWLAKASVRYVHQDAQGAIEIGFTYHRGLSAAFGHRACVEQRARDVLERVERADRTTITTIGA